MSKYVGPALIGLVVGFVVALGMSLLFASRGIQDSGMPIFWGAFTGLFSAYILANLAGNRAGPAATATQKAEALASNPPADKAFLYLYRTGFVAKLAGLNVAVDGKEVAQLKSPRFTCVTVAPGSHTVSAAFGGLAGAQNKVSELTIQADPGAVVALHMTMKMGALKNSIDIAPQPDLGAVKHVLAGITMTQPDLAEV